MANKNFPTIGLALGSGGAKGLAHIGVLKTLERHNIPIDFIAGASVGAFIGAHYAAHKSPAEIEKIIFDFNRSKGLRMFDLTIKGGIVKGLKVEKFIEESITIKQFSDTKIPFTVVATDMNTAEAVILYKGNIVKAVRASIAVPAFFQPISYEKRLLSDGGLSNPVPVDVVKSMGADITIGINLDTVYVDNPTIALPALTKLPFHSVNILRHNLATQATKTADVIIAPNDIYHIGLIGWGYLMDTEKAKIIINAGEKAAEEKIPQIKNAIALFQERNTILKRFFSFFHVKNNVESKM